MRVTLDLDDAIVERIVRDHKENTAQIKDEFERARMEIWSQNELVIAHLQTLAKFWYRDRLRFEADRKGKRGDEEVKS